MTTLILDQIITGNYSIKAIKEDGQYLNHEAIQVITPYVAINVQANQYYTWNFNQIGHDVIPLVLWGNGNTAIANSDDFFIEVYDSDNTLIWNVNLKNNKTILGNSFSYDFAFNVVSRNHIAKIKSAVALNNVLVLGKKCYLESPIAPTT